MLYLLLCHFRSKAGAIGNHFIVAIQGAIVIKENVEPK